MNYPTEMYLDYLDEAEEYQKIFEVFLEVSSSLKMWSSRIKPDAALKTQAAYKDVALQLKQKLAQLQQQKAAGGLDPSQLKSLQMDIYKTKTDLNQSLMNYSKAPVVGGGVSGAPTADTGPRPSGQTPAEFKAADKTTSTLGASGDRPATFDPKGTEKLQATQQAQSQADWQKQVADKKSTDSLRADETSLKQAAGIDKKATAIKPEPVAPQPTAMDTVKDTASDTVAKAKELGTDAMTKAKDIAGAPSGAAGAGTGVAGAVEKGASQLGASPETAGAAGSAVQAIGASPLGMAALGGAAAFGGYKLYKRFLSKSARACTGYSGSAKTGCMKSFMNAKKGQASTRGADVAAAT